MCMMRCMVLLPLVATLFPAGITQVVNGYRGDIGKFMKHFANLEGIEEFGTSSDMAVCGGQPCCVSKCESLPLLWPTASWSCHAGEETGTLSRALHDDVVLLDEPTLFGLTAGDWEVTGAVCTGLLGIIVKAYASR